MNSFDFQRRIRLGEFPIECTFDYCFCSSKTFCLFDNISVRVSPRHGSVKIEKKGIFVGAKVVQGHDWEWGQQDGGKGMLIFNLISSHIFFDADFLILVIRRQVRIGC